MFPEDDDDSDAPAPPADDEPGVEITDIGRAFLLLRDIIARLHIESTRASFEISPEMADDLAAFGAASEDLEQDDEPEAEPDKDGHDNEADIWAETAP